MRYREVRNNGPEPPRPHPLAAVGPRRPGTVKQGSLSAPGTMRQARSGTDNLLALRSRPSNVRLVLTQAKDAGYRGRKGESGTPIVEVVEVD